MRAPHFVHQLAGGRLAYGADKLRNCETIGPVEGTQNLSSNTEVLTPQ